MQRHPKLAARFAAGAVSFALACANDQDPVLSDGETGEATTGSTPEGTSGTSAPGSTSDGVTEGVSSGPEPDTTAGEEIPGEPYETCQRYIECIAVTTPNGLPDAQSGFGEDSACWKGGPDAAELCGKACATGLEQYHENFPDEPACYVCTDDAQCDTEAGELCENGGCRLVGVCGNGLVEDGEICDGQSGCTQDCLGGAPCSPLTNAGCTGEELCTASNASCSDYDVPKVGEGESCGPNGPMLTFCDAGLECVSSTELAGMCASDTCCTALCDREAIDPCKDGFTCKPYMGGFNYPDALSYLGICLP